MDLPYSGLASRIAHYSHRPSVPGVNADHTTPDPEPDPFNPVPGPAPVNNGTAWATEVESAQLSNYPNLAQIPVTHWFDGQPPVPSGVETASRMQAMQERMMVDHSIVHNVPDSIRLHQHFSEGQANDFIVGRGSQYSGETIPDGPLAGLGNGSNGYDQTNAPNEVYSAGESNVGRYRLGVKTNVFGVYTNPMGKFGQDAELHAYTGITPQFPSEKPPMTNTAPYTPNSTGTAHWFPTGPYQVPSMFGLPSETALTDFAVASESFTSEFTDGERL